MHSHAPHHEHHFGPEHAARYDAGTATSLPGYHAMQELIAATMTSVLGGNESASILCVGVGTAQELLPYARYGRPTWRFTGTDTSPHMLAVARERLSSTGMGERMRLHEGALRDLPTGAPFDGAQMVGVLHHVAGAETRLELLREVVRRLKPGAPFIIGESVGNDPVLLAAEEEQLRVSGVSPEKLARRRKEMASLEIPASDEEFFALLRGAGLTEPRQLFASLQFKAFLVRAAP
ncbi:class I SAM-dependent methyltransferase [Corallococcus terminator]|uniref:Class I SAM-dependent methyltransferase n=1 Tax=Corallococcus terminator TaxID=2316733 RepID=A0A3A8JB00_9BACT|nr:class I SAM-dependent methyltransferase [Corallococcus terminator]RKG92635.1 class I SAM-dependent methyltransferase [Corallococcus terminator]